MAGLQAGTVKVKREEGVVYIRLKRAGKRFEVAAYKDKLPDKRTEDTLRDIDFATALQVERCFTNAAKGTPAKKEEIDKALKDKEGKYLEGLPEFPKGFDDEKKLIFLVLCKGDLQVDDASRKEAVHQDVDTLKDLARLIAEKVYKPAEDVDEEEAVGKKKKKTKAKDAAKERFERWTPDEIERELKNVKYHPRSGQELEEQALDAIRLIRLNGTIPIQRFQERLVFDGLAEGVPRKLLRGVALGRGYALVVREEPGVVEVLVDPAATELRDALCAVAGVEKPEVVAHNVDEGDLTLETPSAGGAAPKQGGEGGKKKQKKEERAADDAKAARAQAGDDEDAEPAGAMMLGKGKKGKKAAAAARGGGDEEEGDLSAMLAKLGMGAGDDDDDGKDKGKKKGKGKRGGGGYSGAAPAPAPAAGGGKKKGKDDDEDDDDDEEDEAPKKGKAKKGKRGGAAEDEAETAAAAKKGKKKKGGRRGGDDSD
eukprot:TRINITY_DN65127_c0_g1_i1.p2 TRINITY_DN65127_c0_g1~~TRINITY_DN65127_c0_g1_i1.p2  ORF type:complete len:483 (+),score=218.84 TRINITY_DN65127_c0_g1_i1:90-1538(+)